MFANNARSAYTQIDDTSSPLFANLGVGQTGSERPTDLSARRKFAQLVSATEQRDHAIQIATSDYEGALAQSEAILDPWFATQALAAVLRYCPDVRVSHVLRRASSRAETCHDEYRRGAVSAWIVRALVERGMTVEADSMLRVALAHSLQASPNGSRGEALFLLYQAAYPFGIRTVEPLLRHLASFHGSAPHWRVTRALVHAAAMHSVIAPDSFRGIFQRIGDSKLTARVDRYVSLGLTQPREFFGRR
jgi:hypothetical protein